MKQTHLFWAVLIVGLAAGLRLGGLEHANYNYDEAELSRLALAWTQDGHLPTRGLTSSQGLDHPPLMAYVVAPPYALSSHPYPAFVWVVFLNLLGLATLTALGGRLFGREAGLLAALLYAVSPWAVLYGRTVFPQALNTPFLLLGVYCGVLGFWRGKTWAQTLSLPLIAAAAQIHYAALALLPLGGLLVLMGGRRLRPLAVWLGIGLALLPLLPFLADLSTKDRQAFQNFLESDADETRVASWRALERTLNFATGLHTENEIMNDENTPAFLAALTRPKRLWQVLLLGLALGFVALWRRPRPALLLAGWSAPLLLVTSLGFVFPLYHYLHVLIPALFLLIGAGRAGLLRRYPVSRYALIPLLALIVATQALTWGQTLAFVRTQRAAGYGTPLSLLLPIRQAVQTRSDLLLVGASGADNSAIWRPLLYDLPCLREALAYGGGVALFPAQPFHVLYPPSGQGSVLDERVRQAYTSAPEQLFPLRQDENAYRLYAFDAPPALDLPPLTPVNVPAFEAGAALQGYALADGYFYTAWRLNPPPAPLSAPFYQYYLHFLDAQGERLSQRDIGFWPTPFWCADDRLILWTEANPPAEAVTVRLGLYHFVAGGGWQNDSLAGGGTWLDLPLP